MTRKFSTKSSERAPEGYSIVLYSIARGAGSEKNLAASSCIISRYCSRAEDDFAIL